MNLQLKDLLDAGVQFGHQTRRWNPRMKKYIFGARNGIYIIDLQKSISVLKAACDEVREQVSRGQTVLFVGTKKQARDVVREEAEATGQYHVADRWLGGMLTNFQTIRASIKRCLLAFAFSKYQHPHLFTGAVGQLHGTTNLLFSIAGI